MGRAKGLKGLIRRGYALLFAFVFIFYIGMSVIPAVMMSNGKDGAAKIIYRGFHFLCHQYPWRSWFLKGEQPYYPLTASEGSTKLTFADASGLNMNEVDARSFYGTSRMGYKMAICQRDTAIYGAMAIFALIFFLSRNQIRCIHWKYWLSFGVLPIGLDGGTQLLSQLIPVIPFRESTPLLRTVTGALFGFFLCWFLLPKLEASLREGEKDDLQ